MSIAGPGGESSCSTLRERVQDNFQTVSSQSYRPLVVSDGTNPLPGNLYQTNSGYSLEKASLVPTTKEVSAGLGPVGRGALGWGRGGRRARGGKSGGSSSRMGPPCQGLVEAEESRCVKGPQCSWGPLTFITFSLICVPTIPTPPPAPRCLSPGPFPSTPAPAPAPQFPPSHPHIAIPTIHVMLTFVIIVLIFFMSVFVTISILIINVPTRYFHSFTHSFN